MKKIEKFLFLTIFIIIFNISSAENLEIHEIKILERYPFGLIKGKASPFVPLKIKVENKESWIRTDKDGNFLLYIPLLKGNNKVKIENPENLKGEGKVFKFIDDSEKWAIHSGLREYKFENGVLCFKIGSPISFMGHYNTDIKSDFNIFEFRIKNSSFYDNVSLLISNDGKNFEEVINIDISPYDEDFIVYRIDLNKYEKWKEKFKYLRFKINVAQLDTTGKNFYIDYLKFVNENTNSDFLEKEIKFERNEDWEGFKKNIEEKMRIKEKKGSVDYYEKIFRIEKGIYYIENGKFNEGYFLISDTIGVEND